MGIDGALLLTAAAGSLGALSRWKIGALSLRLTSWRWAGTFVVNVTGSFLFGLSLPLLAENPMALSAVCAGFLGGFTTFSTFSADVVELARQRTVYEAALLAIATTAMCFAACGFGYWILGALQ